MCSIRTNATFDEDISDKRFPEKHRAGIEKRLREFASEAKADRAGGLDNPCLRLKHMDADLHGVSHIQIGRHRVYYIGHHTQCNYFAFWLKEFKKTGVDDDGSKSFQNKLRRGLAEPQGRFLSLPDEMETMHELAEDSL